MYQLQTLTSEIVNLPVSSLSMIFATLRNVVSSATEYSTRDYIHRTNMEMVGNMKATEQKFLNMHSSFSVVPQTQPSHKDKWSGEPCQIS